jgi:predicted hydrolase (HD superfamily)
MRNREESLALLREYTESESLLRHALAVEAAMRWYAESFGEPETTIEAWGIAGLLHDLDWEKFPDNHPYEGNKILKEAGYPGEILTAIMGHATYTGVARESKMARTLFAVDELSGLVTASVLVRPDKSIFNLEAKSVLKKMKDKAFAKGCNRDDIRLGAEELGLELETHTKNVIEALRKIAAPLGLQGVASPSN